MGGVLWYKLVVYILLSAKKRAHFCKSIAIAMGGVSRYFSKVSGTGVDLTLPIEQGCFKKSKHELMITKQQQLSWAASIRHLMWKPSAASSCKFGKKSSRHVMPKVLKDGVWCDKIWLFLAKFWPEMITSSDGCLLLILQTLKQLGFLKRMFYRGSENKKPCIGKPCLCTRDTCHFRHRVGAAQPLFDWLEREFVIFAVFVKPPSFWQGARARFTKSTAFATPKGVFETSKTEMFQRETETSLWIENGGSLDLWKWMS